MSQSESINKPNDEISDPAEALLFIRGVMSASRDDKKGDGGISSFIMAALTLAAGVASWWMIKNGQGNIGLP